ncbi:MAG: hypothetical protein H7Z38_00240 [Rubrivivax sp.]|nr:hypothetical protein [Pyrinomonadaceae bacterium]
MTDASDTKENEDGHVCSWCGTRFLPATPRKTPVCPRCYRLLSSAGLKDKEIFAGGKPGEDKGGGDDQHED